MYRRKKKKFNGEGEVGREGDALGGVLTNAVSTVGERGAVALEVGRSGTSRNSHKWAKKTGGKGLTERGKPPKV